MTESLPPDIEGGLPGEQGEITLSMPWPVRLALAAVIGGIVGFAVSTLFSTGRGFVPWVGAVAASLLAVRRRHLWHVSTFADGSVAGILAGVFYVAVATFHTAFRGAQSPGLSDLGAALLLLLPASLVIVPVAAPCGWLAGFAYHLAITTAERLRANNADTA